MAKNLKQGVLDFERYEKNLSYQKNRNIKKVFQNAKNPQEELKDSKKFCQKILNLTR